MPLAYYGLMTYPDSSFDLSDKVGEAVMSKIWNTLKNTCTGQVADDQVAVLLNISLELIEAFHPLK